MSFRSSFEARDLELLPTEADPLVSHVNNKTFGEEHGDIDASIRESRRFAPLRERILDVVKVYWGLGFIAFGGPSAHVAILRDHLIRVHEWMDEEVFMELFALGQGLPGPSSTQLVISTAVTHGGWLGGVVAFLMWCLPGFLVLTLSGMYLYDFVDPNNPPIWLLGVPPASMSLIAKASYGFVLTLDAFGVGIAMVSCVISIMINGDLRIPSTSSQIVYPALLVFGAVATFIDFSQSNPIGTYIKPSRQVQQEQTAEERRLGHKIGISVWQGITIFLVWLGILVGVITAVNLGVSNPYLEVFEGFYRIGSLIFGGGVVMIPMAQSEFVTTRHWLTDEQFFQGLGLAQSLPGPLFNFSAFIGATYIGFWGAVAASAGLFGPGFILIFAMLPIWSRTRHLAWFKAVLKGLNASAIGLIVGGCFFLYEKSVMNAADAMVFVLAGGLAILYNVQAPGVILSGVVLGALFSPAVLNVGQKPY